MARISIETLSSLRDDESVLVGILYAYVIKDGVKKGMDTEPINRKSFKDFLAKVIADSDREHRGLGAPVIWGSDVFEFITGDRHWFCKKLKLWLGNYTDEDPENILSVYRCVRVIKLLIIQTIEDGRLGRRLHVEDIYNRAGELKNLLARIKDKQIRTSIKNRVSSEIQYAVDSIDKEFPLNSEVENFIKRKIIELIEESEEK